MVRDKRATLHGINPHDVSRSPYSEGPEREEEGKAALERREVSSVSNLTLRFAYGMIRSKSVTDRGS